MDPTAVNLVFKTEMEISGHWMYHNHKISKQKQTNIMHVLENSKYAKTFQAW